MDYDEHRIEMELRNVAALTGGDVDQLLALDYDDKMHVIFLYLNGAYNFKLRLDNLGIDLNGTPGL